LILLLIFAGYPDIECNMSEGERWVESFAKATIAHCAVHSSKSCRITSLRRYQCRCSIRVTGNSRRESAYSLIGWLGRLPADVVKEASSSWSPTVLSTLAVGYVKFFAAKGCRFGISRSILPTVKSDG
jgi:hypothetical protein